MVGIEVEIDDEDLERMERAVKDGIEEGAKEAAEWGTDEGTNKARDIIRIGHRGHPRIWTSMTYDSFKSDVAQVRGVKTTGTVRNTSPHAHIVEEGRRPGAEKPQVQDIIEWVVAKLEPRALDRFNGSGGDDGSGWLQYDSSDDDHVASSQKAYEEWLDAWRTKLENNAEKHSRETFEYKQELRDEFKRITGDAQVRQRHHHRDVEGILEDGVIHNQHVTGESGGMLDPDFRGDFEEEWLGYDPTTPEELLPKYGYLGDDTEKYGDPPALSQYGDVRFIFEDDVRDDTTFTIGDSLDRNAFAVVGDGGDVKSLPTWLNDPGIKADNIDTISQLQKLKDIGSPSDVDRYIEVQIHDELSVEKVRRIVFTQDAPTERMKELMDEHDIEWEVEK